MNFYGYGYDPMTMYRTKKMGLHVAVVMFAGFSLFNLVLACIDPLSHILFSSAISRYLPIYGLIFDETLALSFSPFRWIGILISFAYVAGLLYSWWTSKKKNGKYIGTTILFVADCVWLILVMLDYSGVDATTFVRLFVVDIMFHTALLCLLLMGVHANKKLDELLTAMEKENDETTAEDDVEDPE